ncbi:putative minor tail protein [Escherichia coli]|uniref:Putative minor tail protein n=1 Tax=Escherichia coli TaxID=562 RepID=A0A376UBQ5_ECOLX|nr:putative minor tail protein [Escherichia coli]
MNGKGSSARPSLTVSNLFGLVTGMAEDLQSLVGATGSAAGCMPVFWMR